MRSRQYAKESAGRAELARRTWRLRARPGSCGFSCQPGGDETEVVGKRAQLLVAAGGDPEIIFQAPAAAAGPVNSGFDGQNHSFADCTCARLMRVGRLVRAGAHTVTDGMRGLSGISAFGDAPADEAIEPREAGTIASEGAGFVEDFQQQIEQLVICRREFARTKILGEIVPVTIHTDPDLKQSGLVLLDWTIAGGSKSFYSLARPDKSESARHFDFAFVTDAHAVHEAFEERAYFAL